MSRTIANLEGLMRENLQKLFKVKNPLNVSLLDLNLSETHRKVSSNYCKEAKKV